MFMLARCVGMMYAMVALYCSFMIVNADLVLRAVYGVSYIFYSVFCIIVVIMYVIIIIIIINK